MEGNGKPFTTFSTSMKYLLYNLSFYNFLVILFQAGLTSLEVKFEEWQWEEELSVLTKEEIGLGW